MKWASIPLLINNLKDVVKRIDTMGPVMNDVLFNTTYAASHKYDGTNVGKDESGLRYGRNQTIPTQTKSYQKTSLEGVEKLDAAAIKADICKTCGIGEDSIECFNVYGELMCNKGLYSY